MKKLVIGLIAHVDAGKTTLSEAMLYDSGMIKKIGRVDHGDTFFDNNEIERKRGITVFSKTAVIETDKSRITLIDTPGHVDFSAEMERCLSIMDAAVLVISGTDGIQGHTETLAGLLKRYNIPTFIFVNKMDMPTANRQVIMTQLQNLFDNSCVAFDEKEAAFFENIAMCDEKLLEGYLCGYAATDEEIGKLIADRRLFPAFFGSALKNEKVSQLLDAVERYLPMPEYCNEKSAKVFKILYDEKGTRLTFFKITGGIFSVKDNVLTNSNEEKTEKIDQLRIYSGNKYSLSEEVSAGEIVAAVGLSETYAGQGLGKEPEGDEPSMVSVFSYKVVYDEGTDISGILKIFKILEDEDPSLHVSWHEKIKEIHVQLMGDIQIDILKNIVRERFGVSIDFETGSVVYKETIKEPTLGVGHYEPLRHYGEVHLLIEPAKRNSGIAIKSILSTDILDINYQRQIINSLENKIHVGVLTGSPLTDVTVTLIAGRAHQKHTEGGDMREASWRAVRNGLMYSKSLLLEPYYKFRIEVAIEHVGKVMTDLQSLYSTFSGPEIAGEYAFFTGKAPVVMIHGYQKEFLRLSSGKGKISFEYCGYDICHNEQEIISSFSYEPEFDLDNSADSVFCSHGSGHLVQWSEVHKHAHVRSEYYSHMYDLSSGNPDICAEDDKPREKSYSSDDLDEIFLRTYGVSKREKYRFNQQAKKIVPEKKEASKEYNPRLKQVSKEQLLIIDGFNIIYDWKELRDLLEVNLDAAISALVDIMVNYHGFTKRKILLVFDAYRIKGRKATRFEKNEPIQVIFTGEAESADMYIEKFVYGNREKYSITVATSDGLEQLHVMSQGAIRMSAAELLDDVQRINMMIREYIE